MRSLLIRLLALAPLALFAAWPALGQDATTAPESVSGWQHYDWLGPSEAQKQAAPVETFRASSSQDTTADPFSIIASDSLWQERYDSLYARRLDDALTLSSETSTVTLDDSADLSREQKVGLLFQPSELLTLRTDVHDVVSDAPDPANASSSDGASISAETQLPTKSVLMFGLNSDRTRPDAPSGVVTESRSYDAQLQQPLGSLPLTAVIKGHYEETTTTNAAASSLPSLEQSLVWKPLHDTTLQAGLRQQQYQEYPGVEHELNEALFADWSQQVVDNVSWHSYAEVLNSRGLYSQAPAAPLATGANGTAQATAPGSNSSLTSSLPVSLDSQTLTFSTGPSFKLQKDISASVEYSNRWDSSPAAGNAGQEQRVSISLKGTF
jgi:hypothetical protein